MLSGDSRMTMAYRKGNWAIMGGFKDIWPSVTHSSHTACSHHPSSITVVAAAAAAGAMPWVSGEHIKIPSKTHGSRVSVQMAWCTAQLPSRHQVSQAKTILLLWQQFGSSRICVQSRGVRLCTNLTELQSQNPHRTCPRALLWAPLICQEELPDG